MHYPQVFKDKMVRKMTGPEALSANALAEEMGLSQPTLSRWLREAGDDKVSDMKKKRPHDRSAQERLDLLIEANALPEEELGAFLRRHGVHQAHLDGWRATALKALADPPKGKPKPSLEARQVRELKKELHRKDKALAETAALLVLKKKAQAIWGDGDDDTTPRSGR
jgi:transposase